jgi:hypothetical protein
MPSLWIALVSLLAVGHVSAEVTILTQVRTIYDRTPKLRIKGQGFDADEHDITIELSARGEDPLRKDKDFILSKSDEGIVLKLLTSRK